MLFFDFLAVLAPSWRHLGSILEGFGLDFEGFPISFWLEFEGFPTGFGLDFESFPRRFGGIVFLVLDGLVGSREALRITNQSDGEGLSAPLSGSVIFRICVCSLTVFRDASSSLK